MGVKPIRKGICVVKWKRRLGMVVKANRKLQNGSGVPHLINLSSPKKRPVHVVRVPGKPKLHVAKCHRETSQQKPVN